MKRFLPLLFIAVLLASCSSVSPDRRQKGKTQQLPAQEMPGNHLTFKEIEGYNRYRIVATHYRTDKKELRYVLANDKAFKALSENRYPLPEGSKVVKIGWKTNKMARFGAALEAGKIQRVEYMVKDSNRFPGNPGYWGYARFVKQNGKYRAWGKGTAACIACHNTAGKEQDFLFSRYQKVY